MPGIVPHRHCIVCGKAIEPEEILCSKECREKFEKEKKKTEKLHDNNVCRLNCSVYPHDILRLAENI